jgi:hypothetical protein
VPAWNAFKHCLAHKSNYEVRRTAIAKLYSILELPEEERESETLQVTSDFIEALTQCNRRGQRILETWRRNTIPTTSEMLLLRGFCNAIGTTCQPVEFSHVPFFEPLMDDLRNMSVKFGPKIQKAITDLKAISETLDVRMNERVISQRDRKIFALWRGECRKDVSIETKLLREYSIHLESVYRPTCTVDRFIEHILLLPEAALLTIRELEFAEHEVLLAEIMAGVRGS